jgi:hypothetical protein
MQCIFPFLFILNYVTAITLACAAKFTPKRKFSPACPRFDKNSLPPIVLCNALHPQQPGHNVRERCAGTVHDL